MSLRSLRKITLNLIISFATLASGSHVCASELVQQDQLEQAAIASQQAVMLANSGNPSKALAPAKRALEIRKKLLPKDDPLLRLSQVNLAEIYFALDKEADAEPLFDEVIKSYERTAPDDPARARVLARMALVQFRLGNPNRTEKLYREAVNLLERLYGPKDQRVGGAVFGLADFYQFVGRLKDAEPLYLRLREMREHTDSLLKPDLPEVLDRYACMLRKADRRLEAIDLEVSSSSILFRTITQDLAIEGNIFNGKALRLPKPSYPAQARAERASGVVIVRVMIDEAGNVIRACAISGPASLAQVTESAALLSKFTPTVINDKPAKVQGIITYNFVRQ